MAVTKGMPSVADITLMFDSLGSILKQQYANLGYGDPLEASTTLAQKTITARSAIVGDGTTSHPGLSNTDLKNLSVAAMNQAVGQLRYDVQFGQNFRSLLSQWDSTVTANLPSGWAFASSSTIRPLAAWLMRCNACNALVPATPTSTPSLSATTGGQIPTVASGSAPRVKVTYSTTAEYESQPSSASAQVALAGNNNAYTFTLAGNAPISGYMNVYRQYLNNAGASDPYYLDGRVAVTSGLPHSAYTLTQADSQLRADIVPPVYMGSTAGAGLVLPESAFIYLSTYAVAQNGTGAQAGLLSYPAAAFLDPSTVALNPTSGFLGINNPAATGQLGQWASTVVTAGTPLLANSATNVAQGFVGAVNGVQFRVTSVLDGAASITNIGYHYYDAAHPTSVQTATDAGPRSLSAAVGSTVAMSITAGRIVVSIDSMTVGTATTGVFVAESVLARSI